MSWIDWFVLIGSLLFIVIYGVWKTRGSNDLQGYLKGNNDAKWWSIGISIMATQASAITFLSTPGQAYTDGMRFLQFYLGLPLAMIVLCVTFIPIFYRLKVYTAYEFLESRFDLKTRTLTAGLFLLQRGLAAGITIYAPAIILSTLLHWNLTFTNIFIGVLVIVYTVSGGTRAVTQTQKQQMAIMMGGMILAGIMVLNMLPESLSFTDTMHIAGKMGKMNIVNTEFDLHDRYNIWSGLTAAVFLFMSYFGTDQSQVQRYINGKSLTESRLGLIMNGLLKIPMQFIILFIGVLVFVFYQFNQPPLFFNKTGTEKVLESKYKEDFKELENDYFLVFSEKKEKISALVEAQNVEDQISVSILQNEIEGLQEKEANLRTQAKEIVKKVDDKIERNDKDYIFMNFVMDYMPIGMIGLLFSVMFSAAMSSTASELNALATTTTIDVYKRSIRENEDEKHYLKRSKMFTLLWGVLAILFATYASLFENLIQAVNLLGSLFYGTILGIFFVAFYFKRIGGNAVFVAAILSELIVLTIHFLNQNDLAPSFLQMGYLWFNLIGSVCVVILSYGMHFIFPKQENKVSQDSN
ncbi:MAG: sodium:solute symporter [Crocinitomicaceae bacterium]|nr:sodium:solute symporter [Crocinitomicaceae bacterium]